MDSPPSSVRRPCFAEEDDGLASIAEFSGTSGHHYNHINRRHHPIFSRTGNYSAAASTVVPRRTGSVRSLVALSTAAVSHCASPRSGRIYDPRFEEANHFLEACSLCKKPLGGNRDIFMYRDVPFCSEDCRQDQIQVDEAKAKSISLASMKAMRSKQKKDSSSPDKSQKYPFRAAGTVAAA